MKNANPVASRSLLVIITKAVSVIRMLYKDLGCSHSG